jgi:hypothetical protein
VVHSCNPSYSGGKSREDYGSKSAWEKSSQDPISKEHITKKGWEVAQGVGPEFKPQNCKKKESKKSSNHLYNPCKVNHR